MGRLLLIICAMHISYASAATDVDCSEHKIYCQIISNYETGGKKVIGKDLKTYAMRLSNIIYKVAKKHNMNPMILTAILAQESMYNLDAMNCYSGYSIDKLDKGEYVEGKICSDFGIGQIHYKTIERYEFDLEKLRTDLVYSVESAALVLNDFRIRFKKKEVHWWTRYNASNKYKREEYRQLVSRYL